LNGKSKKVKRNWANNIFIQISKECDVNNDNFIFLAGKEYYKNLIAYLPSTEILMEKLTFLKRL